MPAEDYSAIHCRLDELLARKSKRISANGARAAVVKGPTPAGVS
jgi:hypothetical protein